MSRQSSPRVIVVTGAGSGLGRAFARRLLTGGHIVVLVGRRVGALDETANGHVNAIVLPTDVSDPPAVDALFARCDERTTGVEVLINNAGTFGPAKSVEDLEQAQWQETFAVNVTGAITCSGAAIRRMRKTGNGGRIINVGSLSSMRPRPESAAYAITKHAITGLTRSIALDAREYGISCTQIDVGNAATDMTAEAGVAVGALQPDGSRRAEASIDPDYVAMLVETIVELPFTVSVPRLSVMATGMPFHGRG